MHRILCISCRFSNARDKLAVGGTARDFLRLLPEIMHTLSSETLPCCLHAARVSLQHRSKCPARCSAYAHKYAHPFEMRHSSCRFRRGTSPNSKNRPFHSGDMRRKSNHSIGSIIMLINQANNSKFRKHPPLFISFLFLEHCVRFFFHRSTQPSITDKNHLEKPVSCVVTRINVLGVGMNDSYRDAQFRYRAAFWIRESVREERAGVIYSAHYPYAYA